MAQVNQNELDLARVEHFYELASENPSTFTHANKRFTLEVSHLKVWIGGEHISISGVVPTCDIATTQLKPGHRE